MHKLNGWKLTEHELVHPAGTKYLWYAADNPGLFEGQHAKNMALFIDESKSVADGIAAASERLQATHTLVMSSAGGAVGWFYRCFTSARAHWNGEKVTAAQCSRISPQWIEEMAQLHGKESALYRSMVDAEFSASDDGSFITLESVQRILRNPPRQTGHEIVAGLDSAWSAQGDEAVIAIRNGNKVRPLIAFRETDPMRCAGRHISELTQNRIPRDNVYIDETGGGGGIPARMREMGWPVLGIQYGGASISGDERFGNRMTELWWNMKDTIERGNIILPDDDLLIAQLTSRKYETLSSGKIKLESKDAMRRRGLPSPDRADAVAMCLLSPTSSTPIRTMFTGRDDEDDGPNGKCVGMTADGRFDLGN